MSLNLAIISTSARVLTIFHLVDRLFPVAPALSPPLRSVFQDWNTSSGFRLLKLYLHGGGEGLHFTHGWRRWHLWYKEEKQRDNVHDAELHSK